MRTNWHKALVVSFVLITSSLAGCLNNDDNDDDDVDMEGKYGTVMVSTYHVGQMVSAITGDTVNVEMMSQDNIPVHDYTPGAQDIVRLGEADLFLYHGLGLEPWVGDTLDTMGSDAPAFGSTHAMPTGEVDLDYESMLIADLCELLTSGPSQDLHLSHLDDELKEFHAEKVAHALDAAEEEHDEDGHDDHDEDGHDDHDEDGHDEDGHDDHSGHEGHGHGEAEETIMNPEGCPTDSVISIYHLEEGEYVIEFESEHHDENFNVAVLKMLGGHANHDHGDHGEEGHDEHDEDGHDEHDEDGHDEHDEDGHDEDGHDEHGGECHNTSTHENYDLTEEECEAAGHVWMEEDGDHHEEPPTPEEMIADFDTNNDSAISWDEFWAVMTEDDDHDDDHDDHNDTHDDNDSDDSHEEHSAFEEAAEEYMMEKMMTAFNDSDADGDALLQLSELSSFIVTIDGVMDSMESLSNEFMISAYDEDGDGVLSMNEFMHMMEEMEAMEDDDHDDHGEDGHDDGHDDHDGEHNETEMLEGMFAHMDMNNDSYINASELGMMFEMDDGHDDHDDHDAHDEDIMGYAIIHIEAEGDYGFAHSTELEMFILMNDNHDDHSDHDDHDDHGDESMVCYDMSTHTIASEITTEEGCKDAGLMWTASNTDDDHGEEGDHDEDGHDEEGHDEEGHDEELAYDPHSWLDPLAVKVQVDIILEHLIEVFPEGEDVFTENAKDFKVALDRLHVEFDTKLNDGTCTDKTVVANHNAYSYMAYRYDIDFVTVHGLDPEGEPSPEDIAKVVNHINEEGITVLFVEEYTDQSSVQSIVEETGVNIKILYTMEMAPSDSDDDYMSMMGKNLENIVAGIGC